MYAARIRSFASEVGRAYAYDIEGGDNTEPWAVEFQRQAMPIYMETLPMNHVGLLGRRFLTCADLMDHVEHNDEAVAESWQTMRQYLNSYATAASEHVELAAPEDAPVADIDPAAPSILLYHRLAPLVHPDAINQLIHHADAIEVFCRSQISSLLTDRQKALLNGVIEGRPMAHLVDELHYSERSLFREWRRIRAALGVDSRSQAIAKAIREDHLRA